MCGIAGQVVPGGARADLETVERMTTALRHRGPDGSGFLDDGPVALGMRRLAIIDVAGGDQPIYNEDEDVAVIFNGEIYGYRPVRDRLVKLGHRFSTDSDTEVIAHLWEERGASLVDELRGMFALALWQRSTQTLFLARDRVGKKPLFYHLAGGRLTFASELGALLQAPHIAREPDLHALHLYLALGYVPHPWSAIAGVRKLPPASTLTWRNGEVEVASYWQLDYEPKLELPDDEVDERIRAELREAVELRLISERPLGALLSGGVDSAAVVATMAEVAPGRIRTFSIGFDDERYDELPYARRIAEQFGTEHTEHVVSADIATSLPTVVAAYGEPFGDASALPSFRVAEAAAANVVVALNGDGGDEAFGGYNRYAAGRLSARLDRVPAPLRRVAAFAGRRIPRQPVEDAPLERVRRFASLLDADPSRRYAKRMQMIEPEELDALALGALAGAHPDGVDLLTDAWRDAHADNALDRMLSVDATTYLPGDLLVKMDIATMSHSLEARSPFLDHRFLEFAARLPPDEKVRGTQRKVALRRAFRGVLPDDILDRPKQGFSVPLAQWLRGPLQSLARDVLLDARVESRGQIRRAAVIRLLDDHVSGEADHSTPLWLLLVLELWQQTILDT